MQNELRSEYPDRPIRIVAINESGHEAGNPLMIEGVTAPVLQDVDSDNNGSSDVWHDLWDITYRDVKILNQQNEVIGTVNLTPPNGYDLSDEVNYDALKQIIADVAHERPFWQNPDDPTDVNGDQRTTAVDALQCINELNLGKVSGSEVSLPLPMPPLMPTPYLDVNGDGLITANDALRVINQLIRQSSAPEGESIRAEGELREVEGESREIEEESIRESDFLTDDSHSESSSSPFAAHVPQRLDSATPHTLTEAGDVWGERRHDNRQVDVDGSPFESIRESTAKSGSIIDADSSPLSGDAVDGVFRSEDDMLFADSISRSLIHHGSAT